MSCVKHTGIRPNDPGLLNIVRNKVCPRKILHAHFQEEVLLFELAFLLKLDRS